MTPNEFRRHGREVIDWIADYMECASNCPYSRMSGRAKFAADCPNIRPSRASRSRRSSRM